MLQSKILRVCDKFDHEVVRRSEDFLEIIVAAELKIDFVNDVPGRVGEIEPASIYYRVDSVLNILANKLGALLHRDEAKDVVDIWVIWRENKIDWEEMFTAADSKAAGIYPPEVARKIDEMPESLLKKIKFTKPRYLKKFRRKRGAGKFDFGINCSLAHKPNKLKV